MELDLEYYMQRSIKVESGCREWQMACDAYGYGRAGKVGNTNIKVHREVFYLTKGYYPEVVRHTCDNRKCIEPDHLIGGTNLDNVKDRVLRGRTFNHRSDEIKAHALEKYRQGMMFKDIALEVGVTEFKQVEYLVREATDDDRQERELTILKRKSDLVSKIKELHSSGMKRSEIAASLGVTLRVVDHKLYDRGE